MEDNEIINDSSDENIKRGRGRPRTKPIKEKQSVGRPKKYDHRYPHRRITHDEYKRLKTIERKYLKIIEEINI